MERCDDDISPIDFGVCTSTIIRYSDKNIDLNNDKKEKAIIYFKDEEKSAQEIPLRRLRDFTTEKENPKNEKGVASVDVYAAFPEWSKAVRLVDSPGQNSVFDHHDTLLLDFLPNTDAIIFLIAADLPIDAGEIALLKELSKNQQKKIFFVLSKIDEIDNPEDLKEVRNHIITTIEDIGIKCDKLYEVAAKPVYDGLKDQLSIEEIRNLKSEHGINNLETALEEFIIKNSDETKMLSERINEILKECAHTCKQFCDESEALINKDSFDISKFDSEKKDLQDHNAELRKNTKKALKMFDREWTRTINKFSRKFESKCVAVDDQIMTIIDKGGLIGALFTSFKLNKAITKIVKQELNPIASDLEAKLEEIIAKLNEEMDEDINIYVRNKQNVEFVATTGSVIAASGIGLTASWAWTSASAAGNAALQSIGAAGVASSSAAAATINAAKPIGFFPRVWSILWGTGKAAEAGTQVATATATKAVAATTAISATVSAVISIGISLAVTYIAQKLLHFGLKKLQETRIPAISEKIIAEMEKDILKMLDVVKKQMIEEYTQMIEDIINDNIEKIEEIDGFFIEHNPEKIMELEERVRRIKKLLPIANNLQSRLIEIR